MLVNGKQYRCVWFEEGKVKMINQQLLPHKFEIAECSNYAQVAEAIRTMVIRGAPAIGVAAAYALVLAEKNCDDIEKVAALLRSTRPTANDLFYAIERVSDAIKKGKDSLQEAGKLADETVECCKKIGVQGAKLIKDGARVLTHCNAGWLATVDWGTALAPIYAAKRAGKKVFVFVDETRPRLQGMQLTAWELLQEGIPHAIIADNAAGHFMQKGEVDLVITGADRVALNGDAANKIGTYEKAVLARENKIPFYIAVPFSSFDRKLDSGRGIPIEERSQDEVLFLQGKRIAPEGSSARNPAFDVTPAKYITGIITEKGIIKPRKEEIVKLFK